MVLVWTAVLSVITFVCFGVDKRRAVKGAWRISERTLLVLSFMGGAFGAAAGMIVFHHKVRKTKFRILVPAAVVLWMVILAAVYRKLM